MIILLSGLSSAGKSSIAKAIKEISDRMWLQINIDNFWEMVHPKFIGFGEKASEGIECISRENASGPAIIDIKYGVSGTKILNSVAPVVKLLADNGLDLILDECVFEHEVKYYKEHLTKYGLYYIGVICDMDIIEQREIDRGDRAPGIARGLMDLMDKSGYDFTIDSGKMTPAASARAILEFVERNPQRDDFFDIFKRKFEITGDIISPIDEEWDAEK